MHPRVVRVMEAAERRVFAKPFRDRRGDKGVFGPFCRALEHQVREVILTLPGWPTLSRPLRVFFLSDIHLGSHTDDVYRLQRIVSGAALASPDLACLGGDYVNGMLFGGGRIPPEVTSAILAELTPPLGWFVVLGDHDALYGGEHIVNAFRDVGMRVLVNERATLSHYGYEFDVVGLGPHEQRPDFLCSVLRGHPSIILAHDPAAFVHQPRGPYVMLSGHTHAGQIQLPWIGPVVNFSAIPLRWSQGHIVDKDRHLFVTSGVGTSGLPVRIGTRPEVVFLELSG